MTRPRMLDLFCKAGGAARGYQQAGFHVTGVDIEPQPNYCGDEFEQADALTFDLSGFDAIRTREIRGDLVLCGSMFGLPIRRHRYFETGGWPAFQLLPPCRHRRSDLAFMHKGERAYADAMGCDWMTNREARDAIPPAYTRFIGEQMLAAMARQETA